jgi:predicted adenylyl cyclase CyaB
MASFLARNKDNFEVERKYPLRADEELALPERLKQMGFRHIAQVHMHDFFLPTEIDGEMRRVRDETMEDKTKHLFTHKVWVQVAGKRERKEQEEQISPMVRELLLDFGTRLHGSKLPEFSKTREMYTREDEDMREITVAIDHVEGLGRFDGYYVEVEILVRREQDVESAREAVEKLAAELLREPREFAISYMEMLKQTLAGR